MLHQLTRHKYTDIHAEIHIHAQIYSCIFGDIIVVVAATLTDSRNADSEAHRNSMTISKYVYLINRARPDQLAIPETSRQCW